MSEIGNITKTTPITKVPFIVIIGVIVGIILSDYYSDSFSHFFGEPLILEPDKKPDENIKGRIWGGMFGLATGTIIGIVICSIIGHLSKLGYKKEKIWGLLLGLCIIIWVLEILQLKIIFTIFFGLPLVAIWVFIIVVILSLQGKLSAITLKNELIGGIAIITNNIIYSIIVVYDLFKGYLVDVDWFPLGINSFAIIGSMSVGILIFIVGRNLKFFKYGESAKHP